MSSIKSLSLLCLAGVVGLVCVACERAAPPLPAALSPEEPDVLFDTGPPSMHTFRILNVGGTATDRLGVVLRGDLDAFAIAEDDCTGVQVRPGAWCAVTVALAADDPGTYLGQLHVADQAATVYADVSMSGRVTDAELSMDPPLATAVFEGQTVTSHVAVTNVGGARTGSLVVTAPDATLAGDTCSGKTLAGGASCAFDVSFTAPLGFTGTRLHAAVAGTPGGSAMSDVVFTLNTSAHLILNGVKLTGDPVQSWQTTLTLTNPFGFLVGPVGLKLGSWTQNGGTPTAFSPFYLEDDTCSGTTLATGSMCTFVVVSNMGLAVPATYDQILTATAPQLGNGATQVEIVTVLKHGVVQPSETGSGSGTITVSGEGTVLCSAPSQCTVYNLFDGNSVTFVATPAAGSKLVSWSAGPCLDSTTATCTIFGANEMTVSLGARFDTL